MNSDPAKKAMIDIEGVLKDRASGRAASLKTETREYLDTHPDDAKIMAGAVRVDGSKPPAEALKYVLGAGS